ncbi:phosphatidylinositol polyphosphate 5-phosphatase type IV isoform X2 [Rhipicephalus sanguineus]|uniref:phosphatidylinositol polyphosphate 5-phosphatase type IV isoform X2 n=1 Tax=Rhipicephalus sanguineus TaxID=34632 RepID=UPI0020C44D4A|nr:phosphatidylinositol polyphosphate 5-phosphatase type IV isoform X2 [Rhipicephalus sanguineus]
MDRYQAAEKDDPPKRPSRLTYRKERLKGGTKKSQSLPVIKTPLEELRLVHNNSVTASLAHGSASSSSDDEAFELAPSSLAEKNCVSDAQTPSLRPRVELVRLSSLVKCPSSTSLNRPLSFATEQLLRQTSCVSTGSLKSLSDGTNGSYANKPHPLSPLAKTEPPTGSTRCVTEVKKLHHSWTVSGMSEFQDSVDFPPDQPSILPKISTKDARLRSYLVGNVSGKGSLLGEEELNRYFPDRKVNVFVATWNMNGLASPASLDDLLLPKTIEYVPDIYAIGVQEAMSDKKEWETRLQFTLGPSHVLFHSVSLGVLNLSIFLRRDLIWFCSAAEEATYATRPVSSVKTKGAVAIAFQFFGSSMLFLNSHLADVTARFDHVFWCGDLNFRLVNERSTVVGLLKDHHENKESTYESLLKFDQLRSAMLDGQAFFGFQEGKIKFGPTYKFEVGSSQFDGVKLRVPSYTDRILYRSKRKGHIECILYDSIPLMQTSDHRPVYGLYETVIRPGRDNTRLSAGLFNRDIYLEAVRRRAAALEIRQSLKASQVCVVM